MVDIIKKEILEIERRENIKILFACESGSRAWGFPSIDSDYDVRFIYLRPKDWYLSIDDQKDTLEFPINNLLDISGWDLRKALRLFRGSNPVIYEWLQSPIIYKEEAGFQSKMKNLFEEYYSIRTAMHHYLGMTVNPYKNDLQGERVKIKKYFYALRSILACKWMQSKKSVPPMEFEKLRELIVEEKDMNEIIDRLLEQKYKGYEKELIAPVRLLNLFIQNEIREAEVFSLELEKQRGDTETLNQLFRSMIELKH